MDHKIPLYTGMVVALVLCARNISGKFGFISLGTGLFTSYVGF